MKKLIIGILLSVIPILNLTALGYALENSGMGRNRKKAMPEWEKFGYLFGVGIKAFVVNALYLMPVIIVIMIGFGIVAGDIAGVIISNMDQAGLAQLDIQTSGEAQALFESIFQENWMQLLPSMMTAGAFFAVSVILAIAASYITPMAVLNCLNKKHLGEAFDFTTVARKAFTQEYLIAWIVVLLVKMITRLAFMWMPIVGYAAYFFISKVIAYSIYGQVYKKVK